MEPHLFIIQILSLIDSNLVINNLNGLDESIDSVIKRAYIGLFVIFSKMLLIDTISGFCHCCVLNQGSLVSEATPLPTVP